MKVREARDYSGHSETTQPCWWRGSFGSAILQMSRGWARNDAGVQQPCVLVCVCAHSLVAWTPPAIYPYP